MVMCGWNLLSLQVCLSKLSSATFLILLITSESINTTRNSSNLANPLKTISLCFLFTSPKFLSFIFTSSTSHLTANSSTISSCTCFHTIHVQCCFSVLLKFIIFSKSNSLAILHTAFILFSSGIHVRHLFGFSWTTVAIFYLFLENLLFYCYTCII